MQADRKHPGTTTGKGLSMLSMDRHARPGTMAENCTGAIKGRGIDLMGSVLF